MTEGMLCTHTIKGGCYKVVCISNGAGNSKGDQIAVYKSLHDGQYYHRDMFDFLMNMTLHEDQGTEN